MRWCTAGSDADRRRVAWRGSEWASEEASQSSGVVIDRVIMAATAAATTPAAHAVSWRVRARDCRSWRMGVIRKQMNAPLHR